MSHIYLAVSTRFAQWAGDHLGATPLKIGWTSDVAIRRHTLNHGITRNDQVICAPCLGYDDWSIIWYSDDIPFAKNAERIFKRFATKKFHRLVRKPKPLAGFSQTNGESEIFFFEDDELVEAVHDAGKQGLPVSVNQAITYLLEHIQGFDDPAENDDLEAYQWPEGYEIDDDGDDDDGDLDRDHADLLDDLESDRHEAIDEAARNAEDGWPDDDGPDPRHDAPGPDDDDEDRR